jgi:tetratricopeptide (TPR) repeat protein
LPLFEECLAKRKRVLGPNNSATLDSLNNLAALFYNKGEYDRALPMFEECLAKRKRVLGEDNPDTLASLNNLANLLINKGEYDRALPLYEECLAKRKRILGDDHPDTIDSLNELAKLFYKKGEYDRALPLFEECLDIQKRVLGEDNPDTKKTQMAIEKCKLFVGRIATCAICADQMNSPSKQPTITDGTNENEVFLNPCGHKFHERCIKNMQARNANATCPQCRGSIQSISQVTPQRYALQRSEYIKSEAEKAEAKRKLDFDSAASSASAASAASEGGKKNKLKMIRKRNQYSKKIKY